LRAATFEYTTLLNSIFSGTIVTAANLSFASLIGARGVSEEQLSSVVSLKMARLPNSSFGMDRDWLHDGRADCKIPIEKHWQLLPISSVKKITSPFDLNNCMFAPAILANASMTQRITLINYVVLLRYRKHTAILAGRCSNGTSLSIQAFDYQNKALDSIQSKSNKSASVISLVRISARAQH
jgi:Pentapeptide repeats (8 copies)